MASALIRASAKLGVVAGAVYVTYNQEVWGNTVKGSSALSRAREQLPAPPPSLEKLKDKVNSREKFNDFIVDKWNAGTQWLFGGMAQASKYTAKAGEYAKDGYEKIKKSLS